LASAAEHNLKRKIKEATLTRATLSIFQNMFYLVFSVLTGLLQSIFYLLVGGSLFTFQSFIGWFLLAVLISLATSLGLLKYYHFKKYATTFLISIFSAVVALSQ
jgi:hypothetical protein